jgi:UPF0271 protein
LDAGAFYTGIAFLAGSRSESYLTTEAIFSEVKHIKSSLDAAQALIDSGNLQIAQPERIDTEKVVSIAERTGDSVKLSEADISAIALALGKKAKLITNDYAIANVATVMNIPIELISSRHLKEIRKWITYCNVCAKVFGPNASQCTLCGNKLKRKYKKKVI